MPKPKPQRTKDNGELLPPSTVYDRIDYWLQTMLTTFPSKGELTSEEIEHWHRDLEPFLMQAIDYAFDTHRRNGRFFPVYGDILDICVTFEPEAKEQYKPGCSAECLERHGKGYNGNDMQKLWKMYSARRKELERSLSKREIFELLDKLDAWRGKAPEWRHA